VTLKDVTPPSIVCKPFTAPLNAAGTTSIVPANVFQSGADNCGTVNLVSVTPNSFTCSNLGANTVTLTANDGNGNTSTCNAIVTVVDLIPPTMLCKNITIKLNAAGTATITPAQVNNGSTDNCTLVSLEVTPAQFTCANTGINFVSLIGTDQSGNSAGCTSTITVLDTIAPTMICQNAVINLNASGQATLTVAQVNNGSFDNCSIATLTLSQTQFTCATLGNNTVTLTGTDQSGNSATCTATVLVRDLIAPLAKCKNAIANLNASGNVTIIPTSVDNGSSDNCSFVLTVTPPSFTCANLGPNTITLKATDGSGNTATCTAIVTVKDVTGPTALCKNPTIFLNEDGHASLTPAQVDNGSFDNCSVVTRTLFETQYNCSDIAAPVNNFLTVKDASNNSSTCTALITVKDNIAPHAFCRNTTVTLGGNGTVSVYPSMLADSSFDNCSITTYLPVVKTYTAAGVYNLPITVKDWSGNAATCTSVVTVLHNGPSQKPGFIKPNGIFQGISGHIGTVNLALFPNPASGTVSIIFELTTEQTYQIMLHDMNGKMVLLQKGDGARGENQVPLDLENLANGLYIVELRSDQLKAFKRLMIQKQ
ncbi:MAG: HYR domain-containing protein, partial [Bacteroidota bacterium]